MATKEKKKRRPAKTARRLTIRDVIRALHGAAKELERMVWALQAAQEELSAEVEQEKYRNESAKVRWLSHLQQTFQIDGQVVDGVSVYWVTVKGVRISEHKSFGEAYAALADAAGFGRL